MTSRMSVACCALCAWLLLAAACSDESECQGAEGCACFPNGTCNDGLSCASDFCVDLDGAQDGGPDSSVDPGSSGRGGSDGGAGSAAGSGAGRGGGSGNGAGMGGGSGNGGTVEQGGPCEESVECAALDDPCRAPVCISSLCDSASVPEGSPVDDDTPGDCARLTCGAGGELETEIDPSDVPEEDDDPCTLSACDGATPMQVPAPPGTPAPDSAQTTGDCLRVECDGEGDLTTVADDVDTVTEPPSDPCKRNACDQGAPALENATPGTSCGSDLVCDGSGACVACSANATSCTASAQCCGGLCQSGTTCATCPQNMGDCDGNTGNGCEAAIRTATNCGSCGYVCPDRPYMVQAGCSSTGECYAAQCEAGRVDADDDYDNGCEVEASIGPGGAYGPCTMANAETACGAGERCGKPSGLALIILQFGTCGASTTGCHCGFPCSVDADCPAAPGGTATPDCASGYCALNCTSAGTTCPSGMTCTEVGVVPFSTKVCTSN